MFNKLTHVAGMPAHESPFTVLGDDWSNFTPLNDCILVRRLPDTPGAGNIIVAKDKVEARRAHCKAEVLKVNRGHREPKRGTLIPCPFHVGDIVYIERLSGHDFMANYGTEPVVVMSESQVLGICESSLDRPAQGAPA